MRAKQLWQTALGELETRVSRANFETWLRHTELVSLEGDVATVGAPNSFAAEQLRSKFAPLIQEALELILGRPVGVQFTVLNSEAPVPAAASVGQRRSGRRSTVVEPEPPASPRQLELAVTPEHGLNPRYTFEKFVVGPNNRLAHAAALAVADRPADKFNPLFIYGGVGLGKTHLLHAIGHRALARHPDLKVRYVSSETFTNDLIEAIRLQRTEEFRNRYRTIDILMIDDIQFIAGKESTQEEFFHTFNALYQAGKQIVLSSDRPPKAIHNLTDRLRSRFEGGLIADVQPPDLETRQAILAEKGRELGVTIPPDVLEYIARKVESNIRELEGALNRVVALSQLYHRPVTLELAVEALTDAHTEAQRRQLTPEAVLDTICRYYRISTADLVGPGRRRDIVVPRQVAMYLLREELGLSLVEIGQRLGGRDHTTVLHGIEKIEQQLQHDAQLRGEVLAVRERLLAG
ncbi:chromosomal replication initiator protein DnaA [Thermorudis peleae]|uniref:chromosomal replication initiator protein DnaA n=1 Tax=Thermorudis peleae TaxID=1382356 RepID=UPI00056FF5A3|nr:chromosomal replication initiator protein DnaA [Thermorudis peleae]